MLSFQNLTFTISAILLLTVPSTGYCMNIKRETIPLVDMLQSGKAALSSDKKNILDENGHIVAKETANTAVIKPKPVAKTEDSAKDNSPPAPQLFICNKRCAMFVKHCYMDENENIVCINVCDKESLICE
mgnify:CR=1 FL=1